MAQNWWEDAPLAGSAPAAPSGNSDPIIKRGGPDPYQVAKDSQTFGLSMRDQALQEDAARRAAAKDARDQLEWAATHNPDGSPKPKAAEDDTDKGKIRSATLDSVVGQINRVEELYRSGIRDERLTNLFGALDNFGSDAAAFNSAGQGLADQGLAAFRVPGQGSQSDYEAKQFAMANTPQAGDYDAAIEEKLRTIRARVDANRAALGMAPAQWLGNAPDTATNPPPDPSRQEIPGAVGSDGVNLSRNLNEIDGGNGGASVGFETGATRYEDDPQLAGVLAQYQQRLGRGDSVKDIVGYLRSAGVKNLGVFDTVRKQVEFRRKNPNVPIGSYNIEALDDRAIPQGVDRQVLNAIADSPVGVAAMNLGDAATGFNLDSLTPNAALTRAGMDEVNARNPGSALLGQGVGGVMATLGAQGALARFGMEAKAAGLGADVGYGALAGAGVDDENRLRGAAIGSIASAGANVIGSKVTNALAGTVGGVSSPVVNALAPNTPLTLGQAVGQSGIVGRTVKGVEDRLAGLPIVGDAINARRQAGVEAFNTNSFNRALKPIGADVGGATGEDAVQIAQQAVSDAYSAALKGKAVGPDQPFANQMTRAVASVMKLPRVGGEMADNVRVILEPYMTGGQLTGDAMQQISRELQGLKASYKNDALASRVGKAVDEVEDSVFGLFRRQAPEVLPAYNKAKAAARRLYIVEDAVMKAKNQGGIFTPAQLGQADRSGMSKYGGKRGAAAGKSPFHDFQRAAQEVLPNKVPDSGTAGRVATALALPVAGASAGAGVGATVGDTKDGAGAGLTLGALLTAAYSRAGQRALVGAATKRTAGMRAAGKAIERAAPRVGTITGGVAGATLPALAIE